MASCILTNRCRMLLHKCELLPQETKVSLGASWTFKVKFSVRADDEYSSRELMRGIMNDLVRAEIKIPSQLK